MKIVFLTLLFFSSLILNANDFSSEYQRGEEIYKNTCISCHGLDGIPNKELKLAIRPRNLNKTILNHTQLKKVIANGAREYGAHSDIMPAFKYIYDDEDLSSITRYVYERFAKNNTKKIQNLLKMSTELSLKEKENMLQIGKKVFKKTCSKCHGKTGDADSLYVMGSIKNEDFIYPYNLQKLLLNEDQIFLFAKYGSFFWGSDKKDMPAWKKKYSDAELKSVARYITESIKQN